MVLLRLGPQCLASLVAAAAEVGFRGWLPRYEMGSDQVPPLPNIVVVGTHAPQTGRGWTDGAWRGLASGEGEMGSL